MLTIKEARQSCKECGNSVCLKIKFVGEYLEATSTCHNCGKLVSFKIGEEPKEEEKKEIKTK